jgi:hypothetical protein
MKELNRARVSSVPAADAKVDAGNGSARAVHGHCDEFANLFAIECGEWVFMKNPELQISLSVVSSNGPRKSRRLRRGLE